MATNKNWNWNVLPSNIELRKRKGGKKEKIDCTNVARAGTTVQGVKDRTQRQEMDASVPGLIFKRRWKGRRRERGERKKNRVII